MFYRGALIKVTDIFLIFEVNIVGFIKYRIMPHQNPTLTTQTQRQNTT